MSGCRGECASRHRPELPTEYRSRTSPFPSQAHDLVRDLHVEPNALARDVVPPAELNERRVEALQPLIYLVHALHRIAVEAVELQHLLPVLGPGQLREGIHG